MNKAGDRIAKDELINVRKWKTIVINIEEEERLIRDSFGMKSPSLEEKGGAPISREKRLADAITRLDELEQEKVNCLNMIRYVSNKIKRLKKPEEIRTLHLIYIMGMTIEKAAELTGYTERAIFYIRKRAIEHYEQL